MEMRRDSKCKQALDGDNSFLGEWHEEGYYKLGMLHAIGGGEESVAAAAKLAEWRADQAGLLILIIYVLQS